MTLRSEPTGPENGMRSRAFAPGADAQAVGSRELDAKLERLRDQAERFARLPAAEKSTLLRQVRARFFEQARAMVELANREKGIDPSSYAAGEDWFSGPVISLRALRLFADSLADVASVGAPRIAERAVERVGERVRVTLTPQDTYDKLLFTGVRACAWLEPGVRPSRIADVQASFYRERAPAGHVVLVLGAGNVGSISVLDVLYHMFVEGGVCLLKMSPVNGYLTPFYERAFAPLIEPGYLALTAGGAEVGEYLVRHPSVDAIHVTGSVETHDRIVWGPPGAERERRRRENDPLVKKRITSELGNVSPVLVVPGKYTDRELDAAAKSIAGMLVHNASFNCNAAKMIVTAKAWPGRAELLARIASVLRALPARRAYYPGAEARYEALLAHETSTIERFGDTAEGSLPWTLVAGLKPGSNSPLFRTEPFCSIVSEAALGESDSMDFLCAAPRFANDELWGTLNAMLIVPSSVQRDRALAEGVERAVAELHYGTVGVNVWPAVSYGLGAPLWGGYPGATLADVQSGIGWGHNAFMLERVEKTVVAGPLVAFPEPVWYPGNAHLSELGAALAAFEAEPSVTRLMKTAWAALR